MSAAAPAGNGGPPELEGGDFYAPLFLTMTPDGQIAFDFDGHIRAKGLDIEAHDVFGTEPLPHSTIRWLREADDVQSARMHGAASGADSSNLLLDAFGGGIVRRYARFALVAGGPIDLTGVSAALEIFNGVDLPFLRILFDAEQRSDFLQLADGPADWRLRHITIPHDLASIASGARRIELLAAPAGTVAVGDPIDFLGVASRATSWPLLSVMPESPASVADEICLIIGNLHTSALDFGVTDFDFHVVNRA